MKSLRQVCELTGVDRHVLQRIGTSKNKKKALLPPSKIDSTSRYWYYDDEAIEKLWLILLFRELDCSFSKIQEIMETPGFNQKEWFGTQIKLLERKKKKLDNMIYVADMIKTTGMYPTQYLNVKDYTVDKYLDNAKNMISSVLDKVKDKLNDVWSDPTFNREFSKILDMKKEGAHSNDENVQLTVGRMKDAFEMIMGESAQGGFLRFGLLLYANGDIAAKFDEMKGDGVSTFVGESIKNYCN